MSAQVVATLAGVREEIDILDREIVRLLGLRAQCVLQAAAFKRDRDAVRAEDRVRDMMQARRRWAEEEHLDPDMIEQLYRSLVAHFTHQELEHWSGQHGADGEVRA